MRLRQALEAGFGTAQASDGTLVLLSRKDGRRGKLSGIFSTRVGDRVGLLVCRKFLLTLSSMETVSRTNRAERTDRAV